LARVPSARRAFRPRRASNAGESRRDPRSRVNSARLRAGQRWSVRMMVFSSSRPSIGVARKQEGYSPRAFNQIQTKPPGRWDSADRGLPQRPRSQKPITPASRLVAQSAVGGIRAWVENSGHRASRSINSTPISSGCAPIPKFVANAMKPGLALAAAGGYSSSHSIQTDSRNGATSRTASRDSTVAIHREFLRPVAVCQRQTDRSQEPSAPEPGAVAATQRGSGRPERYQGGPS
jgi:hypothetical protein